MFDFWRPWETRSVPSIREFKRENDIRGMCVLMSEVDKEWHGSRPLSVFSAAKNTVTVKWLPAPLWEMSVLKGMETPSHLFLRHPSINHHLFTCSVLIPPSRFRLFWHLRATTWTARFPKWIPCANTHCHLCWLLKPDGPNLGKSGGAWMEPRWEEQEQPTHPTVKF